MAQKLLERLQPRSVPRTAHLPLLSNHDSIVCIAPRLIDMAQLGFATFQHRYPIFIAFVQCLAVS
jgi:hypothetical protein